MWKKTNWACEHVTHHNPAQQQDQTYSSKPTERHDSCRSDASGQTLFLVSSPALLLFQFRAVDQSCACVEGLRKALEVGGRLLITFFGWGIWNSTFSCTHPSVRVFCCGGAPYHLSLSLSTLHFLFTLCDKGC